MTSPAEQLLRKNKWVALSSEDSSGVDIQCASKHPQPLHLSGSLLSSFNERSPNKEAGALQTKRIGAPSELGVQTEKGLVRTHGSTENCWHTVDPPTVSEREQLILQLAGWPGGDRGVTRWVWGEGWWDARHGPASQAARPQGEVT